MLIAALIFSAGYYRGPVLTTRKGVLPEQFSIKNFGVYLIQDLKAFAARKTKFSGRIAEGIDEKRGCSLLMLRFLRKEYVKKILLCGRADLSKFLAMLAMTVNSPLSSLV